MGEEVTPSARTIADAFDFACADLARFMSGEDNWWGRGVRSGGLARVSQARDVGQGAIRTTMAFRAPNLVRCTFAARARVPAQGTALHNVEACGTFSTA